MQIRNNQERTKEELYSLDQYEGSKKWCFAIVLNKAQTNLKENPLLFEKTLTQHKRMRKQDWFDEETKQLVYEKGEDRLKEEVRKAASARLRHLRNYFSHYFHKSDHLTFAQNDPIRIIMEKAYKKAFFEKIKNLQEDISVEFPDLFGKGDKITSAGVVFFVSFFVERRFLHRLMGYVRGFKKTEGEYKLTREAFSTYCLSDSYSVRAPDHDAVMFRDILGYLSRVPTESYQRIERFQGQKGTQLSERKTNKFISFAMKYLEDCWPKELRDYTACFARTTIKREQESAESSDDTKHRPHREKAKVEIHFDKAQEDLFYIKKNNVILQTQKKGGQANVFKMGLYELKYLVLLSLSGKAKEAVREIDNSIQDLWNRLPYIEKQERQEIQRYNNFLPGFVLSHVGLSQVDDERKLKARLKHVKAKWEEKKEMSNELELHRKGRDVLRYINERCEKPLNIDEYNRVLELLVRKDLAGFYRELEEMKRRMRIDRSILHDLSGHRELNDLHKKVCDLVLRQLESLDAEKLKQYIGLTPKEEKEVPFNEKISMVLKQPVLHKGFLREQFFREDKKSFAKLVEEAMNTKVKGYDVPLGVEYYHIVTLDRFDKANKKLYETLATDRLCLMMASNYYLSLNKKLALKAERIEWSKEDNREFILFTFQNPGHPGQICSIRFSVNDYAKLYVMDDPRFLVRLLHYFFPSRARTVDYHKLYMEGIKKYTNLQAEAIPAILALEKKIIEQKQIQTAENFLEFSEIMNKAAYVEDEQKALKKVRDALLHYKLDFKKEELRRFYEVMKREGIDKKWSLAV